MNKFSINAGLMSLCVMGVSNAFAFQVTEDLDIGGAIRGRYDYDPDRDKNEMNFDTFFLTAKYKHESWSAAAKYRWYGGARPYNGTSFGDISFAEYAWVGYEFHPDQSIQVGLNQVPFGLAPYFGSTFYETLGNAIGFEDVYQVGIKYLQTVGTWNVQTGYYARPAWQGKGSSNGGTYSAVVSEADSYVEDGTNNRERNTFALRVTKSLTLGDWRSELGLSGLTSELKNADTNDTGRRNAIGAHFTAKNGPWGLQFLAARQQMSPRNPSRDDVVTFGSYNGTFNVASRGNFYVADLSYDIDGSYLANLLSGIKLYTNYSAFQKSGEGYNDSERFIVGTSFNLNKFFIATEWLFGKNDPYVGGGSYTQSLAAGGIDHWENQLYVNVGYYF